MTAKRARQPAEPPEDVVTVFLEEDLPQRSEHWYELRRGIPTASVFSTIMATGADGGSSLTRQKLLYLMAGEIISGQPMETFSNHFMEKGIEVEPLALEHYAFTRGVEVSRVGFVRRTIHLPLGGTLVVGCSPDGLVGKDGIVQVKWMKQDLLVELVDKGRFPGEHRAQCQAEMWVTGRRWCDLKIFNETMTAISPTFRIERSDAFIAEMRNAAETFCWDLKSLVERVRAKSK
jgi:hypothetical protein